MSISLILCVGSSNKWFISQRKTETLGVSSLKGILRVVEFRPTLDFLLQLVFEYLLTFPVLQSAHLMRSLAFTSTMLLRQGSLCQPEAMPLVLFIHWSCHLAQVRTFLTTTLQGFKYNSHIPIPHFFRLSTSCSFSYCL